MENNNINSQDADISLMYNVQPTMLNVLWKYIQNTSGNNEPALYDLISVGGIPHSLASIEKTKKKMLYLPEAKVKDELKSTYNYFVR